MARIEGVNLPREKRIEYGLTYVFGIGLKTSQDILNKLNIILISELKIFLMKKLQQFKKKFLSNYVTEGELRKEIRENIKRLQEIGTYRGLRHKRSLACYVVKELKLMLVHEKVLEKPVLLLLKT